MPSAGSQFQGQPLQRGRKIPGDGKILRFSTEIAVYRKRYEIGPRLLWNVNTKSYVLYRMTFTMTLTDP